MKQKIRIKSIVTIILLGLFFSFLTACGTSANLPAGNNHQAAAPELKIHFIDVGQADSILIENGSQAMLIDAGNNSDAELVANYINELGLSKLDYVIGTHPHEDHVGGLDTVIENFAVGKIYLPKATNTTKTFNDVLKAIQAKGLKITVPTPGTAFNLGEAACTIIAPNSGSYEDLNNYSIVLKMEYGDTSFLFTGDAEKVSENEMIKQGYNLTADVLKLGHHGSSSSTTTDFLHKVNPQYGLIMCGKENDYGHPHKETMEKLKKEGIDVYRTDELGTIICSSDGRNISFNVKSGSYSKGVK